MVAAVPEDHDATYAIGPLSGFTNVAALVGGRSVCSAPLHHDCKGHTGAGMSLGQGMAMSYSWKQKINTKSLTEAEMVGANDSLDIFYRDRGTTESHLWC